MYLVFRCVRIRGLEQGGSAAARQQSNQQPSGLLVSPRWSTARKVYRETTIVYLVFRRVRIRGLEQGGSAAVRQQSNQQPGGLLVSPRWSTAGKVYRETAIVYLVFRCASHRIYHCRILRQMIILKAEIIQPENFRPVGIIHWVSCCSVIIGAFFSFLLYRHQRGCIYYTPVLPCYTAFYLL